MCRTRCVLALVALCVGLAHSWDIAVSVGDELRFYTNETKTNTISFHSRNLTALAYDEVHNMMLYVDKQTDGDTICGYELSSIENKCFTERNGRNIHGLAYDPVTESVFFTDTNERSVSSISLKPGSKNNANGNLLIKMYDGIPRDIVVDSCKGYIYWLNTNLAKPTIERARLDGTKREVFENITSIPVNTTYNLEPFSLAIDQQSQAMYWLEAASIKEYQLRTSALNREHKTYVITYKLNSGIAYNNPSNTLTVSKNSFIAVDFADAVRGVYAFSRDFHKINRIFKMHDVGIPVGIVANYNIKDQVQGIQHCDALSRVKNAMENNGGVFCVHGLKVNEQSICKCTPGYTGERCEVSVCENYCLQGSCSLNDAGHPECRCNADYSGDRCEVNACHGHCLNNGACSLNEMSDPVCQCTGDYVGDRCNVAVVSVCENYCFQGNCSLNDAGLPECRCNAGYSGDRCEVNACHGHCLNNGACSLNEMSDPVCQCTGDYVGDRCNVAVVSICEHYCLQGNCSVDDQGLPECRCNAGYSGDRCEVDACHGHCLNNGNCYLNEEEEPSCQCEDSYEGTRCETDTNAPAYCSGERNLTLADVLSSLRKPASEIFVKFEVESTE